MKPILLRFLIGLAAGAIYLVAFTAGAAFEYSVNKQIIDSATTVSWWSALYWAWMWVTQTSLFYIIHGLIAVGICLVFTIFGSKIID